MASAAPGRNGHKESSTQKRMLAMVQVIFIGIIVGFGTYHLFKGNFEVALASFPLLFTYYIFVTARSRRRRYGEEDDKVE